MNKRILASSLLLAMSLSAMPVLGDLGTNTAPSGLQYAAQKDGPWSEQPVSGNGQWVRCQSNDGAVLPLGEKVKVRLAPKTLAHIQECVQGYKIESLEGKAFVRIEQPTSVTVDSEAGGAVATQGEFVVDTTGQSAPVEVYSGDARPIVNEDTTIRVAGPDVRSRDDGEEEARRQRLKGNQHQEQPPAPPPPVEPPPPIAPPPPVMPPPQTNVLPPAPPPPAAVNTGGGFNPVWVIVPLAVGGGIAALVGGGGGDNPNPVASP